MGAAEFVALYPGAGAPCKRLPQAKPWRKAELISAAQVR